MTSWPSHPNVPSLGEYLRRRSPAALQTRSSCFNMSMLTVINEDAAARMRLFTALVRAQTQSGAAHGAVPPFLFGGPLALVGVTPHAAALLFGLSAMGMPGVCTIIAHDAAVAFAALAAHGLLVTAPEGGVCLVYLPGDAALYSLRIDAAPAAAPASLVPIPPSWAVITNVRAVWAAGPDTARAALRADLASHGLAAQLWLGPVLDALLMPTPAAEVERSVLLRPGEEDGHGFVEDQAGATFPSPSSSSPALSAASTESATCVAPTVLALFNDLAEMRAAHGAAVARVARAEDAANAARAAATAESEHAARLREQLEACKTQLETCKRQLETCDAARCAQRDRADRAEIERAAALRAKERAGCRAAEVGGKFEGLRRLVAELEGNLAVAEARADAAREMAARADELRALHVGLEENAQRAAAQLDEQNTMLTRRAALSHRLFVDARAELTKVRAENVRAKTLNELLLKVVQVPCALVRCDAALFNVRDAMPGSRTAAWALARCDFTGDEVAQHVDLLRRFLLTEILAGGDRAWAGIEQRVAAAIPATPVYVMMRVATFLTVVGASPSRNMPELLRTSHAVPSDMTMVVTIPGSGRAPTQRCPAAAAVAALHDARANLVDFVNRRVATFVREAEERLCTENCAPSGSYVLAGVHVRLAARVVPRAIAAAQ